MSRFHETPPIRRNDGEQRDHVGPGNNENREHRQTIQPGRVITSMP